MSQELNNKKWIYKKTFFAKKYLSSAIRPVTNRKLLLEKNSKKMLEMVSESNSEIVTFSDNATMNERKNKVTNFLKLYFDFAYFSGCSPFHFILEKDSSINVSVWFKIKIWKPQQLVCGLLHLIGMIRLLTEVRQNVPSTFSPSPEQYFAIIGSGFRIVFKGLTMKRFWYNKNQFLDIVNYIAVTKLPQHSTKIHNKFLIILYCSMCLVTPVLVGLKNYIITSPSTREAVWWNRTGLVNDGRFSFFITPEYNISNTHESLKFVDGFLAILMAVGLLERLIIGFFFDACLLFGVLTLWSTAHAFALNLRNNKEVCDPWTDISLASESLPKWPDIYSSYKGIRALSFLINYAYGSMITLYLADTILYHSMNLDAIVLSKDIVYQLYLMFFIVNSVMILLLSADACNQMDTLKVWLSKDDNRKMVPLDELNIVLHELNTRIVGIRGSNIFTITYSLVWNMLTTVVTYFIICVQSRGSSRTISSGHLM